MRHNVDAWQIIRVPNRYLSQALMKKYFLINIVNVNTDTGCH